ncbi:MAG: alanine--tRNA ligase [Hyphomicrobiaceae bacterium]|nr:alanine--tRNA ligase [Hyphomicrobiaceae bacterium]
MTIVNDIRTTFLNYFVKNGHEKVTSAPLVPHDDPTLMFTNAGMVQFKNVFTGQEYRSYSRATTAQKCVRAGGKHNDLDNVGYTTRHHTFFEMMGNFSFGDYFKDRAIELAWNFITKELGLNKNKLYVTVYHEDEKAFQIWKRLTGFSDDKIIKIATSDNFWTMGDTGPCGPCSEIFYDHGDHIFGGPPGSRDQNGDRFVEIWNLVFMQFDQINSGLRVDLPKPSVDTGMGLERITALLQGTHDNYEIDVLKTLIVASVELTGVKALGQATASHRVIADHLRASSFLIADGVLPSNEGRGYVLRRIMRRAMRHAHLLGMQEPLLHRLVPVLANGMGDAYPELVYRKALVSETLYAEETRFRKTLERGLTLLKNNTEALSKGDMLSGDVAFHLYDTFGFPLDLTQDALRARDITVDVDGFDMAMAKQRREARATWKNASESVVEPIWLELRKRCGGTKFLGYNTEIASGKILSLVNDGRELDIIEASDVIHVITDQTPFYGESGGQLGDKGTLQCGQYNIMRIIDTQKRARDLFVHKGEVIRGAFRVGDTVELRVNSSLRLATCANHSATHLLHKALRTVLGDHVEQKGSLVGPERLRFDFAHPRPLSNTEIIEVETLVNTYVGKNSAVDTCLMTYDDAISAGATALFGEKYDNKVRVVSMGASDIDTNANVSWSVELCGGTHVSRTGDIGIVRVIGEVASSAGVRRIEALTASKARSYLSKQDERITQLAGLLRIKPENIFKQVMVLLDERKRLERQLADLKRQFAISSAAMVDSNAIENSVRDIAGVTFFSRLVKGLHPKDLRSLVDNGKEKVGSGVVVIINLTEDDKVSLSVGVTSDLTERYNAVDLVRAGAKALGSKGGGGRPDMAQAGGSNGAKAGYALKAIESALTG